MSEHLETLLDELAGRLARGEALDLPDLLARAGADADRLAELADRLLEAAPRREPTPEDAAYIAALEEPPLLRLRLARRLHRAKVVAMLAKQLMIRDLRDRERLAHYYFRLEGALLDPAKVDRRVWSALQDIFATDAKTLKLHAARARLADTAYFRLQSDAAPAAMPAPAARPNTVDPPPAERDELDILFLGTG